MQPDSLNEEFQFRLETIVRCMIQDISKPILKKAIDSQNKWDDLLIIIKQVEEKNDIRNQKISALEHLFELKANQFETVKKKVYEIDKNQSNLTSQNQCTLQKIQSESDIIQRILKEKDESLKKMAEKYEYIKQSLTESQRKQEQDLQKQREKINLFQKDTLQNIELLQQQINLQNEKVKISHSQHLNQIESYEKLNSTFIQQSLSIDDIKVKLNFINENFFKYVRCDEMSYNVNELKGLIYLNKEDNNRKNKQLEDQYNLIEKQLNEQQQKISIDQDQLKQDVVKQVQFLNNQIKNEQNLIYETIEQQSLDKEKKFGFFQQKINEQRQEILKSIQQNTADTNIRLESRVFENQQILMNSIQEFKQKQQSEQLLNYQKMVNDIILCNEQRCRQLIKKGLEGNLEEPDDDLIYNPQKFQDFTEKKIEKFTIQYVENSEQIKQMIEKKYRLITQSERKELENLAKSSEQDKNKMSELLKEQEEKYQQFQKLLEKTRNEFHTTTQKVQTIYANLNQTMDKILNIKDNLQKENQQVQKINQQTEIMINKTGNQLVQLKSDSEIYHQYLNSQINHAVTDNSKNLNYIKGIINWLTSLMECVNVGFCIQYNNLTNQERFIQLPSYFDDVLIQKRFDPISNLISYRVKNFDQDTILYKALNGLQMRYKHFVLNFMPDITCQNYFDKEVFQQTHYLSLNRTNKVQVSQPKFEQEVKTEAQNQLTQGEGQAIMKKRKKMSSANPLKNRTRVQSFALSIEGNTTNDYSDNNNHNNYNSLSQTPINRPIHTQIETTQENMKDIPRGKYIKPHSPVRKKRSDLISKRPMTGFQRVQVMFTQ